MTLLELLVKELPKRGGWPEGASHSGYEIQAGTVSFTENGAPGFNGAQLSIHTINGAERSAFWSPERFECEKPDDYATAIVPREKYEAAIAAQQPAWSGEGLPPIGCECEFKAVDGSWGIGTVLCVGNYRIFWLCHEDNMEYNAEINPPEFRPIRTEADRKRGEAVEIMRLHVTNYNKTDVLHAIEELYDAIAAGKIKGVSLSDD